MTGCAAEWLAERLTAQTSSEEQCGDEFASAGDANLAKMWWRCSCLARNQSNAIEGRGDHGHAIDWPHEARYPRLAVGSGLPPLRHAGLTGSMSAEMLVG